MFDFWTARARLSTIDFPTTSGPRHVLTVIGNMIAGLVALSLFAATIRLSR